MAIGDHHSQTLAGLLKSWLAANPQAPALMRQKAASLLDDLTGDKDQDLKGQMGQMLAKQLAR